MSPADGPAVESESTKSPTAVWNESEASRVNSTVVLAEPLTGVDSLVTAVALKTRKKCTDTFSGWTSEGRSAGGPTCLVHPQSSTRRMYGGRNQCFFVCLGILFWANVSSDTKRPESLSNFLLPHDKKGSQRAHESVRITESTSRDQPNKLGTNRLRNMFMSYLAVLFMLPASTLLCKMTTWGEHVKEAPTSRDERMPSRQARSYPPEVVAACKFQPNRK